MLAERPFVVRPLAVASLTDEPLKSLLAYWSERKGERAYPLRQDILPEDMASLLDRLALLEVLDDKPGFRFRLVGGSLQLVLGNGLTGQELERVKPAAQAEGLRNCCLAALREEHPQAAQFELRNQPRSFTYRVLVLPLSSKGTHIDRLLLAANWDWDQAPMLQSRQSHG